MDDPHRILPSVRWVAPLVLLGLALIAAMPASAQSLCVVRTPLDDPSDIRVRSLGVGAASTTLHEGRPGFFEGTVRFVVYCGLDGELITGARIRVWATFPEAYIYDRSTGSWLLASDPASPVEVSLPTGEGDVIVRATEVNLAGGWEGYLGEARVTVSAAYDVALTGGGVAGAGSLGSGLPTASAGVWAQTPELGSLALFGAGAAGMAGYALARWRARRRG